MTARRFIDQHDEGDRIEHGAPLDLRLAGADTTAGIVEGYVVTWGERTIDDRPAFAPGSFARGLAELRAAGQMPALLWAHDQSTIIGKVIEIAEDTRGLRFRGQLNLASEAGRMALDHIRAGDAKSLSPGYGVRKVKRDGESFTITEAQIVEVSIVGLGAGLSAQIASIRSPGSRRELETHLRTGKPFSRSAARKIAAAAWPALAGDVADASEGVDDVTDLLRHMRTHTRSLKTSTRKFARSKGDS